MCDSCCKVRVKKDTSLCLTGNELSSSKERECSDDSRELTCVAGVLRCTAVRKMILRRDDGSVHSDEAPFWSSDFIITHASATVREEAPSVESKPTCLVQVRIEESCPYWVLTVEALNCQINSPTKDN